VPCVSALLAADCPRPHKRLTAAACVLLY
jgi:hypothetical protein